MNVFRTQEFANVGIDFMHGHEYASTIITMHFVVRTDNVFCERSPQICRFAEFQQKSESLLRLQELDHPDDLG